MALTGTLRVKSAAAALCVAASCSGGDRATAPAPAPAPRSARATLDAAVCDPARVGAHPSHAGTAIRGAIPCVACHAPCDAAAPTARFGALARTGGAEPAWDPATRACAGVYCHGATMASPPAPVTWSYVDPDRARPGACSACHGHPPPAPHAAATRCDGCHRDTVKADGTIDLAGGRHVNGAVEASCSACHGAPPATGAHLAHVAVDPPARAYGGVETLEDRVPGALPAAAPAAYAFGCGSCHPLDASRHEDGTVQVEVRDPAAPAGSLKARATATAAYDGATGTCSGVYCHSSGQEFPAYVLSPGWTSGLALECSGCHGNPPRYSNGGPGAASANTHVDLADDGYEFGHFLGVPGPWHVSKHGWEGAAPITCQACHFETVDPGNVAPGGFFYLDTTGAYLLPGGDPARLASTWVQELTCTTCHTGGAGAPPQGRGRVLPLRHVNGVRDVDFDPRPLLSAGRGLPPPPDAPAKPYWVAQAGAIWSAPTLRNGTTVSFDLAAARYDPAAKQCFAAPCHLAGAPVWGDPYGWGRDLNYEYCYRCHPTF